MRVGRASVIVALLTPFDEDGRPDKAALSAHVDQLVEAGVDAVTPCGTTGEAALLSDDELSEVVRATCAATAGRVPVLAHVGRAYYLRNIVGNLDSLRELPNLWYDIAMLNNWEVLEYLFRTVPAGKILYGSDLPVAVAPGKSLCVLGPCAGQGIAWPIPGSGSSPSVRGRCSTSSGCCSGSS